MDFLFDCRRNDQAVVIDGASEEENARIKLTF